jgi:hypothetical protein
VNSAVHKSAAVCRILVCSSYWICCQSKVTVCPLKHASGQAAAQYGVLSCFDSHKALTTVVVVSLLCGVLLMNSLLSVQDAPHRIMQFERRGGQWVGVAVFVRAMSCFVITETQPLRRRFAPSDEVACAHACAYAGALYAGQSPRMNHLTCVCLQVINGETWMSATIAGERCTRQPRPLAGSN